MRTNRTLAVAGFWFAAEDEIGAVVAFDNMGPRPVLGDISWSGNSIVIDVLKRGLRSQRLLGTTLPEEAGPMFCTGKSFVK